MNGPPPPAPKGETAAVIGAGIVGVSAALWLQRAGYDVVLIDKAGPAEGASFGNGGVLASCSVAPVTGPGLIQKIPKMLFDPDQPLFLRWGRLPWMAPWLLRYLRRANAADARRAAAALYPVIGDSLNDHQALAAGTGAEKWIAPGDYLFIYKDRAHYESDAFGWDVRRACGFEWEEMDAAAFKAYDPRFAPDLAFAARLGGHGRITDPGRYVKDLAAHAVRCGARFVRAEVTDIAAENGRVTGVRAGGETIPCAAAVLAAGVWSARLARRLGVHVPMESERGYHLELWEPSTAPRSPVMIAAGKFVITPMEGRLRLAGIVEFGGLKAPPSKGPAELLRRQAARVLPGLKWSAASEWMGHRPAPADSVPVIGAVKGVQGAFCAFGHHHIGLTGGPKTGRIIAQLVSGTQPNIDLTPYAPGRFG